MSEATFAIVFYLILAMGFLSLVWLRMGLIGITDRVIRKLFVYLVALTLVCVVYAGWKFIRSQSGMADASMAELTEAVIITALFALISGAALCAKQLGDLYGFKVSEVKK